MGKKKNKAASLSQIGQLNSEFDVRRNLQKLKAGGGSSSYRTGEESNIKNESTNFITNTKENGPLVTNDLLNLSENIHSKYDTLKDTFNSEITGIKRDHSSFSQAIAEKYLRKEEFRWIIGGLVVILGTIGTLFYTLSYQNVTNDVRDLKDKSANFINSSENRPLKADTLTSIKKDLH